MCEINWIMGYSFPVISFIYKSQFRQMLNRITGCTRVRRNES